MKNKAAPAPKGASIHALGRKVTSFQGFDTFPTPKNIGKVTCITDEVTSNCPVTGQPDWYVVKVTYTPRELCVESKTLKLYFHSYRNKGLFCEAFASKIADDIFEALKPAGVDVEVTQKPRGGVSIVSHASRYEDAHMSMDALAPDGPRTYRTSSKRRHGIDVPDRSGARR